MQCAPEPCANARGLRVYNRKRFRSKRRRIGFLMELLLSGEDGFPQEALNVYSVYIVMILMRSFSAGVSMPASLLEFIRRRHIALC